MAESEQGSTGKSIKCSECGTSIPVRTFKAGNVTCPACGAVKDLGDDLAERMRQFQANAAAQQAQRAPAPAVSVPTVAPSSAGAGKWVAVVLAALVGAGLVWFLSAGS